MTTRHILVGLDGSPQSEAAALWAAEEAHRRGATLRLLHVWPWLSPGDTETANPGDLRPAALDALGRVADLVRLARPDLAVETAVRSDDPVDGLVAEARGHEMLVLGSRGLGGFAGLLVGSVSLAVAARATVPTVLVREPGAFPRGNAGGSGIVVGLDPHRPADAVLAFAFAEAELRGTGLRAVHAWDLSPAWSYAGLVPPPIDLPTLKNAEAALVGRQLGDHRASHPGVPVVEDVRLGGAAQAVLDAADDAELVVIGRRERRHPLGMLLGPVAHAVLHHCAAPVVVVPHP